MKLLFRRILLFFLILNVPAAGWSVDPDPLAEKIKYSELAKQMMIQGNPQGMLMAGWKLRELYPQDEMGHQFIAVALTMAGRYGEVAGEVYQAEQKGMKSAFLYQRQAEAFFFVGGFFASLYSLKKTEAFLAAKAAAKQNP